MEAAIKCRFCEQDVDGSCRNIQNMQQRAANHITRCGNALKSQQGMRSPAGSTEVQGGALMRLSGNGCLGA
ncbi:hypothetical protein MAE02_58510 [Microvirga aerophila]|uniref:Uncharacterized protein n=1 Tax=Microvirga aerophila TaxID=670291 RepID=A0A512C1R1_9HYPH|nr:hypothetical protein MAE02_58510 [Microvirga aerophila]